MLHRVAAATLNFLDHALSKMLIGRAVKLRLSATGGQGPYAYSLSSGRLADGLTLSEDGFVEETSATIGTFGLLALSLDEMEATASASMTFVVAAELQHRDGRNRSARISLYRRSDPRSFGRSRRLMSWRPAVASVADIKGGAVGAIGSRGARNAGGSGLQAPHIDRT